jgi:ketosteroid isomerase-like protein
VDEVLRANRAFYEAFEAGDMDAMSDLWEHSDRVVCTHPGWRALHGWGAVAASFFALFQHATTQFILTGEAAEVVGDVAWVVVEENVLGPDAGDAVATLNLFVRAPEGWRLVAHQGAAVARGQ